MASTYFHTGKRFYIHMILLHPLWRFIKDFLVRGGFRDGFYGFIVSINSSYEVFLKYIKLRNLYTEQRLVQRQTICLFNSERAWGGGEKWHADVASHLLKRGFKVLFISAPGGPLAKRMKEIGVPGYHQRISNLSFLNPLRVFRLALIFRREGVKSLVTSLPSDMKVASSAAQLAGVPNIIYRRGSAIPIRNTFINRYLLRKVVTRIIANSKEVKRTVLAINSRLVPEEKISIVYNGVNLDWYNSGGTPLYKARAKEIVLGSAGRLSEEKGHLHLLDLMKVLDKSTYKFKLLIAGQGKLLDNLQNKGQGIGHG